MCNLEFELEQILTSTYLRNDNSPQCLSGIPSAGHDRFIWETREHVKQIEIPFSSKRAIDNDIEILKSDVTFQSTLYPGTTKERLTFFL